MLPAPPGASRVLSRAPSSWQGRAGPGRLSGLQFPHLPQAVVTTGGLGCSPQGACRWATNIRMAWPSACTHLTGLSKSLWELTSKCSLVSAGHKAGCILGHCVLPGPPQQAHMQPCPRTCGVQGLWDRNRKCADMGAGTPVTRVAILRLKPSKNLLR